MPPVGGEECPPPPDPGERERETQEGVYEREGEPILEP